METEKKKKKGYYITLGIVMGLPLGVPVGLVFGNIALGPLIGVCTGLIVGWILEKKYNADAEDPAIGEKGRKAAFVLLGTGVFVFVAVTVAWLLLR